MKKSRFTESQIVAILKEGEVGVAVAQLTRRHGISGATYYHWKSKYSGAAAAQRHATHESRKPLVALRYTLNLDE